MADDTVKKLLIKLGISTADWKVAINEIKSQLNAVNERAKTDAAAMKAIQKEQISLTKQQILDQQKMVAEAKVLEGVDRAKAAWQKQQQAAIQTAITQRKLETEEAKKQGVLASIATKQLQDQIRLEQQKLKLMQQQQAAAAKAAAGTERAGGGGGFLGNIGGGIAGMVGGGPLGIIAGGAAIGTGITEAAERMLDSAIEKMHHLAEAIVEATGPAAQLREQFEKLAKRAGEDPDEYLNKLRTATRGLADDVAIYRIANNYMQQGLKVTNDDIVKLVGHTVDLARAQGKDATQAMQALERASKTGRTQILAMVTGLSRQELQLRGVSSALDLTSRKTMEFNQVLTAMEARLKAVGTPATTLPELFKQLHNVQKNFIDDLAIAISKSQGYKDVVSALSKMLFDLEPVLNKVIKALAHLTDLLELVKPLATVFMSLGEAVYALSKSVVKVVADLTGLGNIFQTEQSKINPFREFIGQLALGFYTLGEYIERTAIRISGIGNIIDRMIHVDYPGAIAAYREMNSDLEKSKDEYLKNALGVAKFEFGIGTETKAAGVQHNIDPNAIARLKQEQQLQLAIAKETAKLDYEIAMEYLKRKIDATKAAYEEGRITLQQEVNDQRELYEQEHKAKLKQIEDDRNAEVNLIVMKGKETHTPQKIVSLEIEKTNKAAELQRIQEETQFNEKIFGLDQQLAHDEQAAKREHVQALNRLEKEGVDERLKLLEKEFGRGLVDVDAYMTRRKQLINDEYTAVVNGLDDQLEAAKKNNQETQKIEDAKVQAEFDRDRKIRELNASEDEIRLKSLETTYKLQTAPIETQIKLAKGDITGQSIGAEVEGEQELLAAARKHLQDLLKQTPQEGSDAWDKQQEDIEKTKVKVQELNQELIRSRDISGPLSGIFGSIGSVAGALGGTGASRLFGNLQAGAEGISVFSTANQAIKSKASENVAAGLPSGPTNIITSLASSFKDLFDKTKPLSTSLAVFGKGLQNVLSGVEGFVKSITGAKSGGEGALGGGISGAQMGANFGPIGALVGAGAGATMGGIFGHKEKELQMAIHKIQVQLQSIVSDLQSGTISLSQAIADLRRERQQAIQMLAQAHGGKKGGGKKGGSAKKGFTPSQAQAVIEQIDSQIQQLVNQQSVILQNLTTSLMELSNPMQFQEYLQSLDQIITKYQEFASAAQGNSKMVKEANLYLNDSLNQYVQTLSQQLNQAQQQAIQDALTLINLEYQRQQIINQEAQQEYDILTQGVLVRQRTTAMTKGQEIGQLRYQRDMQLQQMDEQIALDKHKVAAESKIFDLATTRIGLETELLAAQSEQADYQVKQVQALAQVVAALTSGLKGGQLMSTITQLMSSGAMPTESGIMFALLQMLGLSQNVPPGVTGGQYGTTNWLSKVPAADASAAQYVASLDPNFPNLILNKQFAAAASDAQQYVQQGNTEGYNMTGLMQWLKSQGSGGGITGIGIPSGFPGGPVHSPGTYGGGPGRPGRYPGAAEGGDIRTPVFVGEQGPELLTPPIKGTVIPNPIVNLLNKMTDAGSGMVSRFGGLLGGQAPNAMPVRTPLVQSPLHDKQISVHKILYDMTSRRTALEMNVISARTSQLHLEMQHLSALNETLANIQSSSVGGAGSVGLEDMLQKVYEVRGRYGSATFRREVL